MSNRLSPPPVGRARPEILAPAGTEEMMRAAVENGADAIYFGLQQFNARLRANNFDRADLPRLMAGLHERGVKGYVTMNTLIFSAELPEAAETLRACSDAGVDAVLVQDLGLALLASRLAPELPIHASTQMTVTSAESVKGLEELGLVIDRVVAAREMSRKELRRMRQDTQKEIEVFVHGAICVAYSGQCLTSEALGGRSANRGECAQACRLPYDLIVDGEKKDVGDVRYVLSPKDLAAYEDIGDLMDIGIVSLKIEGRLKTPHYVAATVQSYRAAIETALEGHAPRMDEPTRRRLEMTFSRGFTGGYLHETNHQAVVEGRYPKKRGLYLGTVKHVQRNGVVVRLEGPLKLGDGIVFDAGRPDVEEEGGRVYEMMRTGTSIRNFDPLTDGVPSIEAVLRFGEGSIRFDRIKPGQLLWKTSDQALESELAASFAEGRIHHRRPVCAHVEGRLGAPLTLTLTDEDGVSVMVRDTAPAEQALKRPLTEAVLRDQVGRLGNTPFEMKELSLSIQGELMVPMSRLNDLRRRAAEELIAKRRDRGHGRVIAAEALAELRRDAFDGGSGVPPLPTPSPEETSAAPLIDRMAVLPTEPMQRRDASATTKSTAPPIDRMAELPPPRMQRRDAFDGSSGVPPLPTPSPEETSTASPINRMAASQPPRMQRRDASATTKNNAGDLRITHGASLPHWLKGDAVQSVTFRLADSLPASALRFLQRERESIIRSAQQAGLELTEEERHRLEWLYSEKAERYLDAGEGSCVLAQDDAAKIVAEALHYFEGERYRLIAWCVMPNHVHVLLRTADDLEKITHSWKSFTAKKINAFLGKAGILWQKESHDRLVRTEAELLHHYHYIWNNPEVARLRDWKWRYRINEDEARTLFVDPMLTANDSSQGDASDGSSGVPPLPTPSPEETSTAPPINRMAELPPPRMQRRDVFDGSSGVSPLPTPSPEETSTAPPINRMAALPPPRMQRRDVFDGSSGVSPLPTPSPEETSTAPPIDRMAELPPPRMQRRDVFDGSSGVSPLPTPSPEETSTAPPINRMAELPPPPMQRRDVFDGSSGVSPLPTPSPEETSTAPPINRMAELPPPRMQRRDVFDGSSGVSPLPTPSPEETSTAPPINRMAELPPPPMQRRDAFDGSSGVSPLPTPSPEETSTAPPINRMAELPPPRMQRRDVFDGSSGVSPLPTPSPEETSTAPPINRMAELPPPPMQRRDASATTKSTAPSINRMAELPPPPMQRRDASATTKSTAPPINRMAELPPPRMQRRDASATTKSAAPPIDRMAVLPTEPMQRRDASATTNALSVLCRTMEQVEAAVAHGGVHTIYTDFEDIRLHKEARRRIPASGPRFAPATIRVMKPGESPFVRVLLQSEPDAVLVRNLAAWHVLRSERPALELIGDYSLNVANDLTAGLLYRHGLRTLTPSYDLNIDQLLDLLRHAPPEWFEVTAHQYMPMFHMEHCVFCRFLSDGTDSSNCGRPCESHSLSLRDRVGYEHPVKADAGCRNTVFNATAQSASEYMGLMREAGVRRFRIDFLNEDAARVAEAIEAYLPVIRGESEGHDLWRRLRAMSKLGVTRGSLDHE